MRKLMEHYLPNLSRHFEEVGLEVELFMPQWLIPVFSSEFSTSMCYRTIDLLFISGTRTIFIVCLAILGQVENDILGSSFEHSLGVISNIRDRTLDESGIIEAGLRFNVNSKILKILERQYKSCPNQSILVFQNAEGELALKYLPEKPWESKISRVLLSSTKETRAQLLSPNTGDKVPIAPTDESIDTRVD
jgi:hypothetical protein